MLCLAALWAVGGSPLAQAQPSSSCESLLGAADERYVQREFSEAEALVRACLAQADLEDEEAVQAYRLLTLISLRQDDRAEAEQAVRQLLGISSGYAPDPVQDPPSYVDLVASVREALLAQGEVPAPADSLSAVPPAPQAEAPEPEIEIVRADPDPPEVSPPTAERAPARRSGFTRWLLIGGGVVAAGMAAVLISSGGSSTAPPGGTPLPPPPAFPR